MPEDVFTAVMRFPVHRLILASGSEQLGALLNGHFSEGDQAGTREMTGELR